MSDTTLEPGDHVRYVHMPSKMSRDLGSEPTEAVGEVVDIVDESKWTGPSSKIEQTLVIVELDDGTEKRVDIDYVNADIDGESGGVTLQPLTDDDEPEREDEEGPEIVADGGEDVTDDLSDTDIEAAIQQHDDPDHSDSTTVEEARDTLAQINADVLAWWNEHQDALDAGSYELVHEDRDVVVLADHTGHFWQDQLDAMDVDGPLRDIVTSLHHTLAWEHSDYSWGAVSPVVVTKTQDFRAGEQNVLREIARRTDEYGSVARAVDSLATETHGWSKSGWARLTGRNPSTVSRTTDN